MFSGAAGSLYPSRHASTACATVRSSVYAVNARIDEVLKDDENRRHERRRQLHSAGRNLATARSELATLVRARWPTNATSFAPATLGDRMTTFLAEAQQASQKS